MSEIVSSVRPGCISVARSSFRFTRESRSDRRRCARTTISGQKETSCNNDGH